MIDWLFRNRETGRLTVAQVPNVALALFLATVVAKRLAHPTGTAATVVAVVGVASLTWWALDELVRGVNPWRRILGAAVLAVTVAGVVLR